MRILHTADWHLADRLKQVDRTADLRRNVERVAAYCEQESVDVLLIAGDLFSDLARPDALQSSLAHLSFTFRSFLLRGGTIVAIAGNHDRDIYCETLRRAFQLAAPNRAVPGDTLPTGRFYLINRPVYFQLCDRRGQAVSFVCMPYPTTSRYLHGGGASEYNDFDDRSERLRNAFLAQLHAMVQKLDEHAPRVLMAHINAVPRAPESLFRCGLEEDIVVDDPVVTGGWDYVALGHLHGSGKVKGLHHVRYCGSIDRLSIAEKEQRKGVVLLSLDGGTQRPKVRFLPLPATPFHDICISDPWRELPLLPTQYPKASEALVRCHVRCPKGEANLYEILSEVSRIFPRCYERTWSERRTDKRRRSSGGSEVQSPPAPGEKRGVEKGETAMTEREMFPQGGGSLRQLVMDYLSAELVDDGDRAAILSLAQRLMEEFD